MRLHVPVFPDERFPQGQINDASLTIAALNFDLTNGGGRIVGLVHLDAAIAKGGKPPINHLAVDLGQVLASGDMRRLPVIYPTLAEFLQDPEYAAAFEVLLRKHYEALLRHPDLAGATAVQEPASTPAPDSDGNPRP